MSHNVTLVNSQSPSNEGDVALSVSSLVTGTASSDQTIRGNASNEYEFGAKPADVSPLSEYFYACNTTLGSNTFVTASGYITQYIDNRSSTDFNVESGIVSTNYGGDGVNYGGGSSRVHSQLIVDEGVYFCEFYPCPKWSSTGDSVQQFTQGDSGTADVKGNRSYSQSGAPPRSYYARVISSSSNQRVWPEIISNTSQRLGAYYSSSQSMIAYKI